MTRRPRAGCPQPGKVAYRTRRAAERQAVRMRRRVLGAEALVAYRCICGSWHTGHDRGVYRRNLQTLTRWLDDPATAFAARTGDDDV